MKRSLALGIVFLVVFLGSPAGAQTDAERQVDVTYDIGDFDAEHEDWPVTVVYVSGDLDDGEAFTVFLGDDVDELWSSTQVFHAPVTAVTVVPFVPVGAVTRTAVAQDLPVPPGSTGPDAAEFVSPPPAVLDDIVVDPLDPTPSALDAPGRVSGPIAEVLSQGAGGGGGGLLALSMVLSVVLVAILFRTPLPSQATQRWTK